MPELIIDTSTDLCLLALASAGQILDREIFPHLNLLSKNLLPSIQQLLEKNKIVPSDLSWIAAGIGPGSYTGTRLGATVAKSLAFGLGIKVKPFSSPLAFLPRQGSFAAVIPTRAGMYFVLKGMKGGLIGPEELVSEVSDVEFLVCPSTLSLPEELKAKPRHEPSPNLPQLAKSLDSV
jgi:tRNA threonylcarbamoyl adenosine modification protein YeaZ